MLRPMAAQNSIDPALIERFQHDGYLVVPGLAGEDACARIRRAAEEALHPLLGPAEFEAEVGYPGAPGGRAEAGGDTPRRLLHAYARDAAFRRWAGDPAVVAHLRAFLGSPVVCLSQCHHNCIMTKMPGFSSETHWHQDIRYWSFDAPELVTVWLALGEETQANGALRAISGSHRLRPDRGRLDSHLFLRPELPENHAIIDQARLVTLAPGDALFFHCRLFHAAGANRTDRMKLSVVFTYHTPDNAPIAGTRSAQYPSIRF